MCRQELYFFCVFFHIFCVSNVSDKFFGLLSQLINTDIIISAHQSIILIQIHLQDVTFFDFIRILVLSSSGGGGKSLAKPRSVSIDVVIKKKISNKKAISAVELELISGTFLFPLAIVITF